VLTIVTGVSAGAARAGERGRPRAQKSATAAMRLVLLPELAFFAIDSGPRESEPSASRPWSERYEYDLRARRASRSHRTATSWPIVSTRIGSDRPAEMLCLSRT
jgi:hypothetical protein